MTESMLRGTARGGTSRLFRWGVPIAMVVVGTGLMLVSGSTFTTGVGVSLVGGSVIVLFVGWFARLGDDSERIRERSAREEFAETGRWPDGDLGDGG